MTALHQLKYRGKSFLAASLGPLLAQSAVQLIVDQEDVVVVPVPLHPRRLRERGFNQGLLLARHVARQMDADLDFLSLRRIRYTRPQTCLKREARRKNVHGAFQVVNPAAVKAKCVLLVDDVATTGNTLNECAKVLKQCECGRVLGLVLAKADYRS